MARPLLPLLCGTVALLLPWTVADTARCSRPKDVANAHIDAGNNTVLNARLRYTCNPGYKRKAGTSSLIHCTYSNGSTKLEWTPATLQCIRDPALPPLTPGPELPTTLRTERTTQRAETSLISSPSPTATPGLSGAASRSPVSPAPDQLSPKTSTLPGMSPSLQTSTPGEGTSPLSPAPMDQATASVQTLAPSIGLSVLAVAGIVFYCCWRRRRRRRRKIRFPVSPQPQRRAPAPSRRGCRGRPSYAAQGSFGGSFGTDPRCRSQGTTSRSDFTTGTTKD